MASTGAMATTSEKKYNWSSSTFTFSNFVGFIVSLMAATKSTATATATTSEKKKPVFVKVETLKPASTAATKSTATTSKKKKPATTSDKISECLIGDETALSSSLLVTNKMYAREPVPPFVSTAEMVKKFQSNIREMSLPPMSKRKHKLTLTRPKQT
ncbi:hypothetical protein CQW23_23129 [Capsicum baccatum]|uniref:Uncharacterized protein n=1 Tax=Capsicum baccatum TaxID=33114 RepID=A0A2G2VR22_CAPBA|nr:hypothetical protein CQW23_23129 [Capsicum baccatum]